jgi:hypothetical protein
MTTYDLVAECLVQALVDAGVRRERIHFAASFEQLGAEPVTILRAVEVRYGVRTRRGEIVGVHTVGEAVYFVLARVTALSRQQALSEAA